MYRQIDIDIVYIHTIYNIYQIFFIHLSVGGHFDSFYVLAIVNNAMNMGLQISFQDSDLTSFRYMSRSGIAGSYASAIFNISKNLHTISIFVIPTYIPTNSAQGFPFLHIFTNTYLLSFL